MTMKLTLVAYTPNPETMIARAARICYDSQPKDLAGERKFIQGLVKSGHTATIEHASATFLIEGVSRALTHELVRHRLFSFCQRSQRYVKESEPAYVTPDCLLEPDADIMMKDAFEAAMKNAWSSYRWLLKLGMKPEDARFVLPNACQTTITVSGNFREWRNFLQLRLSPRAQWEIRKLAKLVLEQLNEIAPSVFGDLVEQQNG